MKETRILAMLLVMVMTVGSFTIYASGGDYANSFTYSDSDVKKAEIVTDIYKNNIERGDKKLINNMPKVNEKEILEKVLDNLSSEYKVIEQSGKLRYGVNAGKYNYIVLTDYIVNEDESLGRSEYSVEIN